MFQFLFPKFASLLGPPSPRQQLPALCTTALSGLLFFSTLTKYLFLLSFSLQPSLGRAGGDSVELLDQNFKIDTHF